MDVGAVGVVEKNAASVISPRKNTPRLFTADLELYFRQASICDLPGVILRSFIITMAGLLSSARNPLCLVCIRRLAGDDLSKSWFPFYRQLRGKKKIARRTTTIKVKLLEDIKGYGKKGDA